MRALEVDLEYPKELCELHNDYHLAPDETKIEEKMLSKYQVTNVDLYKVPTGNAKKIRV